LEVEHNSNLNSKDKIQNIKEIENKKMRRLTWQPKQAVQPTELAHYTVQPKLESA
jgi:hypothetical protein